MLFFYVFASIVLISSVSFVTILLFSRSSALGRSMPFLVSFAAGSLLGEAFLHALPESFEHYAQRPSVPALLVLAGVVAFFFIEKAVHWHHSHTEPCDRDTRPAGRVIACGSVLHNVLDGVMIAAAFLVDPVVGMATVTAILFHEIPQEISTFSAAVSLGMSVRKALIMNAVGALASLTGGCATLLFGVRTIAIPALAVSAGGFLYIALSDLVPEIHKERGTKRSAMQLVAFAAGLATMYALALFH